MKASEGPALFAALCMAIAMCTVAASALAAKPAARTLTRSTIPEGFAVGSGKPPLALKIEVDGEQVKSVAVVDAAAANVTAAGDVSDGEATLSIKHALDVTLKFDLYVSADGERFEYASSCAITPGISGFELWQRPIRAFALGNPRVIGNGRIACD